MRGLAGHVTRALEKDLWRSRELNVRDLYAADCSLKYEQGTLMNGRPEKKDVSIEGLRLVSSLAILIHHFLPYATGQGVLFGGSLQIFVDLFFVISGIVISKAYGHRVSSWPEYGLFMQRRLARIYPLHLATLAFFALQGYISYREIIHVNNPERYRLSAIPSNLLLTQSWFPDGVFSFNQVTWSISAELFCYLIFPLIALIMLRKPKLGALFLIVLAISCAALSWALYGRLFIELVTTTAQLRALPSFCFGVWLTTIEPSLTRFVPKRIAPITTLALSVIALILAVFSWNYALLLVVWALVAVVYASDITGAPTIFSGRFLSGGGKLTYSIYMIHPIIASAFLAFAGPKFLGTSTLAAYGSFVIAVVTTFVLAQISYRYFEEPLRQRLGKSLFQVRDAHTGAMN